MAPRDSESVLDVLDRRIYESADAPWIDIRADHLRALLDVARAAEVINEQIWTSSSPDSEAHYQATVALRDSLRALTTPSEQKEET